nr:hypothetical protein Iba_chr11aCG17670 [Ipomoea batatas]
MTSALPFYLPLSRSSSLSYQYSVTTLKPVEILVTLKKHDSLMPQLRKRDRGLKRHHRGELVFVWETKSLTSSSTRDEGGRWGG